MVNYKKVCELEFSVDEEGQLLRYGTFVKDTPHYQYVLGDIFPYIEWQMSRGKDAKIKTRKFDKLIKSVKKKGIQKPILVEGNRIIHGHHRAAIALAFGEEEIRCRELS